jgi:hypothetical protein
MTQAVAERFSVDEAAPSLYAGEELETIKASFAENGYVVLRNVISGEALAVLASRIVAEYQRQKMSKTLFAGGGSISGHLNCFPGEETRVIYDALREKGILDLIKVLFPKVVRLPNLGCNLNLPGSAAQHFHMDSNYFTEDFLICNVAVVDTDLENGAIEVIPGTHKKYYKFWRFALERPDRRRTRIPMKRGDILIRTSNLWHRGMPNRSAKPRPMVALTWEDGGSSRENPFGFEGGKIAFFPNWYSPNLAGQLRERTFVAIPFTYSAYRFVRSFFGNKNYAR